MFLVGNERNWVDREPKPEPGIVISEIQVPKSEPGISKLWKAGTET